MALTGAGLVGSPPVVANDGGPTASSIYAEPQDLALLYTGQLPPDAGPTTNRFEQRLSRALSQYQEDWGNLPQGLIASGPVLRLGSSGKRVSSIRSRLGLSEGLTFDAELATKVRAFRDAHGLKPGAMVDREMVVAFNVGSAHFAAILRRNLNHAADLPDYLGYRYVHVDLTNQRLEMIEADRVVDTMAIVAGRPETPTPAMAGLLRHAVLNPYWNVPPDLVRDRYARRIIGGGSAYLARTKFEVLSDFTDSATIVSPTDIDWRAVESGETTVRLRQRPGPGNGMGDMKFMFPNALGIYLHDTPSKQLFEREKRLFSAGCVRLERPRDFGRWLFNGRMPEASGVPEERAVLPFPVPIYITHFTAVPKSDSEGLRIEFRDDIYSQDAPYLTRLTN